MACGYAAAMSLRPVRHALVSQLTSVMPASSPLRRYEMREERRRNTDSMSETLQHAITWMEIPMTIVRGRESQPVQREANTRPFLKWRRQR